MTEVHVEDDGIIRVMPEVLANKIAAGEVVQRPASVVKELVENAVDAGAATISVIVKSSGRELIRVIDDGCGMSPRDASSSFQRHATSKIKAIEDLERIRTLGFRGEALASIAAVSRVELRTRRTSESVGTLIRIEGGAMGDPEPCATPAGTSVSVRNLFYNVPARRNFLKSRATELRHVIDTFRFLALANSNVAFSLHHDGEEMLRVSSEVGNDSVRKRIRAIFGQDIDAALVPVNEATSYLTMQGYVGRPDRYRRSAGEQFLFVNGRIVKSRYLGHAVRTAFGNTIPESTYPFFVLFLELEPRHVDVNVHPTKAEVKFDDEGGVYGFVRAVVKRSLGLADLIPQIETEPSVAGFMPNVFAAVDSQPESVTDSALGAAKHGLQVVRRGSVAPDTWAHDLYGERSDEPREIARLDKRYADDELRFWQVGERYIVTPTRSGLLLVDQYGAHQRIIYERALASLESGKGLTQQLLFPQTLEFPPGDFDLMVELMPELRALGFQLEDFGARTVIVRGIPSDLKESATPHILQELLEQYRENAKAGRLSTRENIARSICRRGAVRYGIRLGTAEMRSLVDQLFLCESPYSSPDGRPTLIRISADELARRFGR